jgi:hypothetical protein
MIESGFRTRTTRSETEMAKYAVKVGDTIKHFGKSADGTTKNILARVTAIHPKGTPGFKGTWNKEGWREADVNVIDRFKDGAAAIEFEVIEPSTSVKPVDSEISQEIKDKIKANNLEEGEYDVILVNGNQTIILKTNVPGVIKKGFNTFYSESKIDGLIMERVGKKIVMPGFEDLSLMMEQGSNIIYETTTGLNAGKDGTTQKERIQIAKDKFTKYDIRKMLKDIKKLEINKPGAKLTNLSGEPLVKVSGTIATDIEVFNKLVSDNNGELPESFMVDDVRLWKIYKNGNYNLVDKDTGAIYMRNVNMETGKAEVESELTELITDELRQTAINEFLNLLELPGMVEKFAELDHDTNDILNNLAKAKTRKEYNDVMKIIDELC